MIRAVLGAVLLVVGLPLLLAGGVLWFAMQHQDAAGGYRAPVATIHAEGYAVIASDVDALLRREAPFARGGRTSLRLTAYTDSGPAFVGLAPATEVARYLASVPYLQVDRVRLARGALPVSASPVVGNRIPAAPGTQPFWLPGSGTGSVEWNTDEVRGERLALVVMDPQPRAPLTVDMTAHVRPQWIGTTTAGLLTLGATMVLLAVAGLAWPARTRDIIYVVPPAQLPEVAAHLGVPIPSPAPAGGDGTGEFRPSAPPEPERPALVPEPLVSRVPTWAGDPTPPRSLLPPAGEGSAAERPRSLVPPPDLEWPPIPRERSDRVTEEIVDRPGVWGRR